MAKVFVLNRGAHDYSRAERFGELVYLTDGMLAKNATSVMFRIMREAFKDSAPEDFIVISSLSTLCSIACSEFSIKHGKLNLLLFNGEDYICRNIKF